MSTKVCFKCGVEKSTDDFYRHDAMADGFIGKCKTCTRTDVCLNRHTSPRVRAYDRDRAKRPERAAAQKKITAAWKAKHPERVKAQTACNNAIRDGRMGQAPECCEGCNLPQRVEKHHPDYTRPFLVMWLCKPCHAIADKVRRKTEQNNPQKHQRSRPMDYDATIRELTEKRDFYDAAIAALHRIHTTTKPAPTAVPTAGNGNGHDKRSHTLEQRQLLSHRAKQYWATRKANEAKAKLAMAAKKRWETRRANAAARAAQDANTPQALA